jgi:hypothetical protein
METQVRQDNQDDHAVYYWERLWKFLQVGTFIRLTLSGFLTPLKINNLNTERPDSYRESGCKSKNYFNKTKFFTKKCKENGDYFLLANWCPFFRCAIINKEKCVLMPLRYFRIRFFYWLIIYPTRLPVHFRRDQQNEICDHQEKKKCLLWFHPQPWWFYFWWGQDFYETKQLRHHLQFFFQLIQILLQVHFPKKRYMLVHNP